MVEETPYGEDGGRRGRRDGGDRVPGLVIAIFPPARDGAKGRERTLAAVPNKLQAGGSGITPRLRSLLGPKESDPHRPRRPKMATNHASVRE